eukprot:152530_1
MFFNQIDIMSVWQCQQCTLMNHRDINFCEACHTQKNNNNVTEPHHRGLQSGTIIEWKRPKRCNYWSGYVLPDKGKSKIFVDGRDVNKKLFKGNSILFKIVKGPRGLKAIDVVKLNTKNSESITMIIWNLLCSFRFWINLVIIIIVFIPTLLTLLTLIVCLGIDGIVYLLFGILVCWCCVTCSKYFDFRRNVSQINGLMWILFGIIFALMAILFMIVYNHDIRIGNLEYGYNILADGMREFDHRLTNLSNTFNDTLYTPWLEKEGFVKVLDDQIVRTINRFGLIRRAGCFIEGTQIQIDKYGNTKNIEDFRTNDYIYSPFLDKEINVIPIYGNETGYMYQFITNDSFSMIVTVKHPMLICVDDNCNQNIAAKNVYQRNSTLTINGQQQFIKVKQIQVENVKVYNLLLMIGENEPITSRIVIANGIYSLDFHEQQKHEIEK